MKCYTSTVRYTGPDRVFVHELSRSPLAPTVETFRLLHDNPRDCVDADRDFSMTCDVYVNELRERWRANVYFRNTVRGLLKKHSVTLCCCDKSSCHAPILQSEVFVKMGAEHCGTIVLRKLDELAEHHCHAIGCKTHCKPELLMCGRHWRMVPKPLQNDVYRHYRSGQCEDMRPSEAWHQAADAAIRAVALLEGTT